MSTLGITSFVGLAIKRRYFILQTVVRFSLLFKRLCSRLLSLVAVGLIVMEICYNRGIAAAAGSRLCTIVRLQQLEVKYLMLTINCNR